MVSSPNDFLLLEFDLEPMDIITVTTSLPSEIPSSDVTTLEGYTSKLVNEMCTNSCAHLLNVESISYDVESSKNDSISKKNKSIELLDGMNDLWKPLNKLVTKVDTLDDSKVLVPKFISSSPLINLYDYENDDDDDNEEEDDENVTSLEVKEHKASNQNALQ
ncbi:hypothetical protein H5410_045988 [Solanum commersonii]|uniref:Uncharacterized protein n=1 Tax=Solanum commersonii TaxID=4109 RepID=A0A9J5XCV1_SOLCO|nr:hypothetical protein H5410_045988 [Solanum commersonii]